ncbi:hypothetical protein GA0115246_101466, partial [Streptomyces sp. SolWspMP-sol7th]
MTGGPRPVPATGRLYDRVTVRPTRPHNRVTVGRATGPRLRALARLPA